MSIALATRVQDFLSWPTFVFELCIVVMPFNKSYSFAAYFLHRADCSTDAGEGHSTGC